MEQAKRAWQIERGASGGTLRLGSREALPPDAVVSITGSIDFALWQTLVNMVINQLVMRQMRRSLGLIYAELYADLRRQENMTLTVWHGKAMTQFRDRGAHGWAKRWMAWAVYGGRATTCFLTYRPADGLIPTREEAMRLALAHGKRFERGRLVQSATRPAPASHAEGREPAAAQPGAVRA